MIEPAPLKVNYQVYRGDARDGDALLWRPHDEIGNVIARATNGPYCHASAVVYVHDRPFQSAYREGQNGFLSPLAAEVRRNSGTIDVYRVPGLQPGQLQGIRAHLMDDLTGDYEWANIAQFALDLTWLGRTLERIPWLRATNDRRRQSLQRSRTSAICSQHVARAYDRGGNVALCPGRPFSRTSPNDLARSARLKYHCTLIWPEEWKR